MFPFFNKKEFKIEDKKTGNNIYIKQESFKTENDNYRIEGVSTSVFMDFSSFNFSNFFNPFSSFMLPFSKFLSGENNMQKLDKTKKWYLSFLVHRSTCLFLLSLFQLEDKDYLSLQ